MTELRRRMDEDMVVRGMADRTRETYLWAVEGLARYYRRSPDQISDQEVQDYLRYLLRDRHRSWNTLHIVVHGLRFFYHTTLKRSRMRLRDSWTTAKGPTACGAEPGRDRTHSRTHAQPKTSDDAADYLCRRLASE